MLSQFQSSYQRVEAVIQRLTDSIAAYNPSTTAAEELVAADDAVNGDIEQLVKHQQNHLRLQELRRTADSLDEQIKNTISLLADTRKAIQSIPSSDTTEQRREVEVAGLLAYAKLIAPTTVPPTFRKPILLSKTTNNDRPDAQITNGIATPPQGTSQDPDNPAYVKEEGLAVKGLEDKAKAWIFPQNFPFDPWPSGELMKQGALGKIQKMLEENRDPSTVLTPEEQAEVDRKRQEEDERLRVLEEEKQKKAREEWGYGAPSRRQTVVDVPFNPDDL